MKISACMIARNEEKVIARCIESYHKAVDEIIVVDTGSTDQTIAIAKSLGAKVFHFTWIDDFAAAKNYAIAKAKGDWIIFLDADEYFANHTGANVRSFLKKLAPSFNSVACKMINIDEASNKVLDVLTHVRIFKNDKYIRYTNPIHEMLQNMRPGKKIEAFLADPKDIVIHHTGYSDDKRLQKAERNLELLLRELPHASVKPGYYQYIADCYFGLEDWEKVIEYTKLVFDSNVKFAGYNVRPHQNLIDAMLRLKYSSDEIMREINIAIEKYPYHPLFHFYKGNLLYDLKQYDAAFNEYQEALTLNANYDAVEINTLPINLWMVYNTMGAICEHRNDYGAAVDYYIETLKLDKHNAPCFDRLLMLIRNQSLEDIILLLNKLYNLDDAVDLDFVATQLVNHSLPRALAYYTNLREKKAPKQDYVVLQMLAANRHYDKAFPILLECYDKDKDDRLATIAATVALLSGNRQNIDCCLKKMPAALVKLINAYSGQDIELTDEDRSAYLNLVNNFILWAEDSALERLLDISNQFSRTIEEEIGNIFVKKGYYQAGWYFYTQAIEWAKTSKQPIKPSIYFNQGYCLHRLNEHAVAVQAFVKAYDAGYKANDIYEFLRWNMAKMDESNPVRGRIEEILRDRIENNEFVQ